MENKFRYYGQIQDLTGKAEETINHKFKTIGGLRLLSLNVTLSLAI